MNSRKKTSGDDWMIGKKKVDVSKVEGIEEVTFGSNIFIPKSAIYDPDSQVLYISLVISH